MIDFGRFFFLSMSLMNLKFTLKDAKEEETIGTKVYALKFCDIFPQLWNHFVSAASNTVSIYCIEDSSATLIRHFIDEDRCDNPECFYSCTWASSLVGNNNVVVVVGGHKGVLKVLNTANDEVGVLHGHGGAINEIKTHSNDFGLVLSASQDRSVRLWNIRTLVCVAIFAGDAGHREEVLSLDVHMRGNCFVSSSQDTSIKIWNLLDPLLCAVIKKSDEYPNSDQNRTFKTIFIQRPLYSTTQIHRGYVDCVKWVGDGILSKSTHNRIVLWAPDSLRYRGAPLILQEYTMQHGHVWFLKMDVHVPLGVFAVGGTKGEIFIYPVNSNDITESMLVPAVTENNTTERYQFAKSCDPIHTLTVNFNK